MEDEIRLKLAFSWLEKNFKPQLSDHFPDDD